VEVIADIDMGAEAHVEPELAEARVGVSAYVGTDDGEATGTTTAATKIETSPLQAAGAGGHVDGMLLERGQGDDLQGQFMSRSQHDVRSSTVVVGTQPVRRSHTPAIPRHETRKAILRHGRREVVTDAALMLQELGRHHRTDRVAAAVLRPARAAPVSVEASEGIRPTRLKLAT
jgi:hypothetical protein